MSCIINGSAGLTTNSGAVYDGISRGTAVASTSGTSIDFTGIPSWVKRISVMAAGVSLSGTSLPMIQLGTSGGFVSSGYTGECWNSDTNNSANSTGFKIAGQPSASYKFYTRAVLESVNSSTNLWINSVSGAADGAGVSAITGGGMVTLSGVLTQIRITTVNGTDTFDAGTINIMYE